VITAPSQPVNVPAQQPRGQISTLAPGQFGQPDSRPQTINPNDVRVYAQPRFNPQQPGGQTQVAPVISVTPPPQQQQPARDRFDRGGDEGGRRFRPHDEQRQQQTQVQVQQQQQAQPQQVQQQPQPRQFTPPPQVQQQPQAQPAQRENREPRHEQERRSDEKNDRRNKQNLQ
jgi:hypothetical protein